jgi:hypothetical protein
MEGFGIVPVWESLLGSTARSLVVVMENGGLCSHACPRTEYILVEQDPVV